MNKTATNPFTFGDLALDEAFTDREEEIRELVSDMRNGQNVLVYAPRRYGKSSLVLRAAQEAMRRKTLVGYCDLMMTPTKERLAAALAKTIYSDIASPVGQAFERAGLTPADVDVCQLYDAFTSMVLLTLEGLGFCGKGEGGPFVDDGKLRVGGALPTNTDGGGLSSCHPGMRGMFLMVEAVKQLRGECGDRQVADAKIACASGTGGWFSSSSTLLLGVE